MNIFKLFEKKNNSKDVAKERLQLVLVHDRANVSPQIMEQMKNEIMEVISKFLEIDDENSDIQLERQNNSDGSISSALTANITVKAMKRDFDKDNQ